MQFDARVAAMPDYFRRTRWLYDTLRDYPRLRVNPAQPQANMLHIHVPVERDRLLQIRNEVAARRGVWLLNRAAHAQLPGASYTEWYVGDNLLALPDEEVRRALALWSDAL
jgi:hypothetical protein